MVPGAGAHAARRPGPARDPDRFHFNPHDPTPAVGGASLNLTTSGPKEQSERGARRDVLTYTGPVLREDLSVVGPLSATLFVRSSLEHTDFFVRLCDVDRKGKSTNISDGIVRLAPGTVDKDHDGVSLLEIALWPTANTFRAGHRIRLQVSSAAHPLYARNTGTGEPMATGSALRSADQEVFAGGAVPVFDRPPRGSSVRPVNGSALTPRSSLRLHDAAHVRPHRRGRPGEAGPAPPRARRLDDLAAG